MDRADARAHGPGIGRAAALRRLDLRVPEGAAPVRADKALRGLLPTLPAWQIRDLFAKKDVRLNGKRVPPDALVQPGDTLCVFAPGDAPDLQEIIFEDASYIIINKRQGVATQGEASAEAQCAAHTGAPVFACHRLDVQTGGLLLLAKHEAARAAAEAAFRDHTVQKTYRAVVVGCPSPRDAALHAYLRKDADAARVRIFDAPAPHALPIETRYRVLESGSGIARLEIDLITGRTHQIRAHLAHIGHPVLGEDKYGDREANRRYGARKQKLWATGLMLWDGRRFWVNEGF